MKKSLLAALVLFPLALWPDARSATNAGIIRLSETYHKAHPDSLFQKTLAVFTPVAGSVILKRASIGPTLAAYIKERLSHSTVFTLVERENLDKVLQEIELDVSGVVDPSKAPRAGELLGADLLLTGMVTELADQVQLSLQLVDTASAKLEAEEIILYPRQELLVSAEAYVRSSFQSPNGVFITPEAAYLLLNKEYNLQDQSGGSGFATKPGYPGTSIVQLQAGYRLLPFLSVGIGGSAYIAGQFLGTPVKVTFPGGVGVPSSTSIRYLSYFALGPNLFADAYISPTPRLNLGLRAEGIFYPLAQLSQDIQDMPVLVPDWTTAGFPLKNSTRRVTVTGFAQDQFVYGLWLQASAEYLLGPKLALTFKAGYYYQPVLWPNAYSTSSSIQSSKSGADVNGTFAEYQGFDFARQDGTLSSPPLDFNPSAFSATLGLSLQI